MRYYGAWTHAAPVWDGPDPGDPVDAQTTNLLWVPVIGPSTYLLWQRLYWWLCTEEHVDIDDDVLAQSLGLTVPRFAASRTRLVMFQRARWLDTAETELAVEMYTLAPHPRHLRKIPEFLQSLIVR